MAIVTEIGIPPFAAEPGTFWAGSQGTESGITLVSNSQEFTPYFSANGQAVFDQTTLETLQGIYTGSWQGNANNWDLYQTPISGSAANVGIYTGSWPGNANNWDLYQIPYDDHGKSVITSETNQATQGDVTVDWNFFPFPPEEEEEPMRVRDLTRFQKAYSFTRHQPVRIRLFRK